MQNLVRCTRKQNAHVVYAKCWSYGKVQKRPDGVCFEGPLFLSTAKSQGIVGFILPIVLDISVDGWYAKHLSEAVILPL